jgi:hypothetical protein
MTMQIEVSWRMAMFLTVIVGAYLLGSRWPERIRHLRLTYFRPWRGDPWPQGVQEETDVHWSWRRPTALGTAASDGTDGDAPIPVDRVRAVRIGRPDHLD